MERIQEALRRKKTRAWLERSLHDPVVAWVKGGERGYWSRDDADEEALKSRRYEIGSITKTMTGCLLASLERDGRLSREDAPAALAPELAASAFASKTTLAELVSHTSGLPRLPANMRAHVRDKENPYAAYGTDALVEAVLKEPYRDGAKPSSYSNYGFGLLGWLLARSSGEPLAELLQARLFEPLGLERTTLDSDAEDGASLRPVHRSSGAPAKPWTFGEAMAGAGAVRSTAPDLLRYAEAQLAAASSRETGDPVRETMRLAQTRLVGSPQGVGIGYAWIIRPEPDGSHTFWHNGGTYGSSSFLSFNPEHGAAIAVLSNRGASAASQLAPLIGLRPMSADLLGAELGKELYRAE
ncbi:Beta-lactamase class C penicillin binding protein [Paenibacillus pasadenensis]|uniref:Beta-lactamase class C penicillin binding protein n=1 Tax=Paenibacillus pasadenensis TaxID=217090 RepID=A0A2N5N9C4_9BACL|nr:serine hydrolase domain-containing protein [Paenibacillus pasadenensis]PLT46957.1 Beta-lactamase class C penicillin binding protein [Paenibacillus pasadenensis]